MSRRAEVTWQISGPGGSVGGKDCFPGTSMLYVKGKGLIRLSELSLGDEVLTFDECKRQKYTKVIAWLHRSPKVSMNCLQFKTKNFQFPASSRKHLIGLEDGSFTFAENMFGKKIAGFSEVIESMEIKIVEGMFAPLTQCGTYLVYPTIDVRILAHSFCNIKNPHLYLGIVKNCIKIYDNLFEKSQFELHPMAKWLSEKFSFLTDD